ncbi:MAG TPA: O-antigen ligase family protein [Paludibacter sp.]|nr:O-antigen ligase family protein [Paludibacter sp.]
MIKTIILTYFNGYQRENGLLQNIIALLFIPLGFVAVFFSWLWKNRSVTSGILLFAYMTVGFIPWPRVGWFGIVHIALLLWFTICLLSFTNGKRGSYTKLFTMPIDKIIVTYFMADIIINLLKGTLVYEQIYNNLILCIMYFCISATISSKRDILTIIGFGVVAVFLNCFDFFLSYYLNRDQMALTFAMNVLMSSSNGFAISNAVWIGLAIYQISTVSSKVLKIIYLLGATLSFCALFMAGSKIATFCMVMLISLYFYDANMPKRYKIYVMCGLCILSAIMFLSIILLTNIDSLEGRLERYTKLTSSLRDIILINTLEKSTEHLILGSDIGYITKVDIGDLTDSIYDRELGKFRSKTGDEYFEHTHCWYTQVLLDTGLIGLGFLVFLLFTSLKSNFRHIVQRSVLKNDSLFLCLKYAMIAILIIGLFQNVRVASELFVFFLLFARMANSIIRFELKRE